MINKIAQLGAKVYYAIKHTERCTVETSSDDIRLTAHNLHPRTHRSTQSDRRLRVPMQR